MLDASQLKILIDRRWDSEIVPTLIDYIRIPNKSPAFDPDWAAHGFMDQAVALFAAWARTRLNGLEGADVEVVRLEGRTPVILIELPGSSADTVLLYGHLDKQPEMTGWDEGLGPWTPVLRNGQLFGRGGADDGYAMFSALSALLALRQLGQAHGRTVILIEACEESGSGDLPFYVDHLASRIGTPSLVICLDSGCGNYDQLWLTTSLRGLMSITLNVRVLSEGVHSGDASGIVPSSFRILRRLLSRLEDEATGKILPDWLHVAIPAARQSQVAAAAEILGDQVFAKFPFLETMRPASENLRELILNRTWRPQLEIIGLDGAPPPGNAGNVLRPFTTAKLSLRLPPSLDADRVAPKVKALLESDPPYGAAIEARVNDSAGGWDAPDLQPWLRSAIETASNAAFGKPPAMMGEGGSIPFMRMLGEKFPAAQFVVTGVLGPRSNAHGPNEFLDIPTAKRVSETIGHILVQHRAR